MIEFQGAGVVAPGDVRLLEPITLTLDEHRVSIIGANGSGKSTLARLINGLIAPHEGTVSVNGHDTRKDVAHVRRDVGFLFTDPNAQLIMPTAIEDVTLSLRRVLADKAARAEAAAALLAKMGLTDHAHVPVHALSGGQKQLLALAGLLAVEPTIIVADEPTTLLDLHWRQHVDGLLAGLPQQVIELTHDLDAAARADRCVVIDDADVVFDGIPARAVAHYRKLMKRRSAHGVTP